MTEPFDDPDGVYHLLVNAHSEHCLWPAFVPVPDGWLAVLEDAPRADCLRHVREAVSDS